MALISDDDEQAVAMLTPIIADFSTQFSGGTYEGRAHVVRNFDDLFDLEEGDVLVTAATGESFNAFLATVGAIVTDHGSFASHAAIMGREMGFPAVVGTVDGTARITSGMRVRVDGDLGTVTIVAA